jgi:VWFA-related protein
VLKAPVAMVNAYSDSVKRDVETSTTGSALGLAAEDDEVVRVETNLANLNVSVYDSKSRSYLTTLAQSDFQIFEDGREQTITFFAKTDVPFDLVLLIDVSSSTRDKVGLIRKSTRRFIEAARPADRLAVVTFSSSTNVISPLTENRAPLLESIKNIESEGGSNVWDALSFTLSKVLGPKTLERRRAVVFMTDGVDNKLSAFAGPGSEITFADLLETVRRSEALIIPIYLDTEGNNPLARREYETARRTLALLAEESGGVYYKAKKIEDLEGVYEQVIDDLGKVYSLGYRPTNEKRDGSWRTLKVQLPNHPDLVPRSRPGYYAN